MKQATPQDVLRIALRANISTRTVERYYAGRRVHMANRVAIEAACAKLGLRTAEEHAARDQAEG